MDNKLKKIAHAFMDKGGIFMFIRAQFSSQIATLSDFSITIILAKFFSLYYVYATFLGSVCGGIINCIVNYKWTFRSDCKKKYVMLKYGIVWMGSIFLNTWGIFWMTETITQNLWVQEILNPFVDNIFIFSKIVVSLLVGFFWNYNMQRVFVYRDYNFRGLMIKKSNNDV